MHSAASGAVGLIPRRPSVVARVLAVALALVPIGLAYLDTRRLGGFFGVEIIPLAIVYPFWLAWLERWADLRPMATLLAVVPALYLAVFALETLPTTRFGLEIDWSRTVTGRVVPLVLFGAGQVVAAWVGRRGLRAGDGVLRSFAASVTISTFAVFVFAIFMVLMGRP